MPGLSQIKASAGSGKTHTLTERFIALIENNVPLEAILAITFTNAAASEMRSRILLTLKRKALFDHSALAHQRIKDILHNFSALHVQTIDSLLFQLARTAALALGLNPNFEPVFSTKETIEPYLEILASKARGGDHDIAYDLLAILASLYHEGNARGFTASSRIEDTLSRIFSQILNKECEDITEKNELYARRQKVIQNIQDISKNLLEDPAQWKMQAERVFKEFASGNFSHLESSAFTSKADCAELFRVKAKIQDSSKAAYAAFKREREHYLLLTDGIKAAPFITFGRRMVAAFEADEKYGAYLHSDVVPNLVFALFSEILPANDRFIAIGARLLHVLIDEFQDTSDAQWNALSPLVEEALANGGNLTWVGDIKQSIFGWRGGNPDLFDALCGNKAFSGIPVTRETLATNWRSLPSIVTFVNTLFAGLADERAADLVEATLPDNTPEGVRRACVERLNSAFAQCAQVVGRNDAEPGIVFAKDTSAETCTADIAERICEIHERRPWSDMLVLVRTNPECREIARELFLREIPVVTENSLLLAQNGRIVESIAFLRFLTYGDPAAFWTLLNGPILNIPEEVRLDMIERVAESARANKQDKHLRSVDPIPIFREHYPDLFARYFTPFLHDTSHDISCDTSCAISCTAYDLVHEWYVAMNVFSRFPDEDVFLRRFLEILFLCATKNITSPTSVLEYWAANMDNEKVPMPEAMNAVRVMTIHKAKGLQAPVVLVPWKLHKIKVDKKLSVDDVSIPPLRIPVFLSKRDKETYYADYSKTYCESINLLYVAVTRACEELYILRTPVKKDILEALLAQAGMNLPYRAGEITYMAKAELLADAPHKSPLPPTELPDNWRPMQWLPNIKIARTDKEEASTWAKDLGLLVHATVQYLTVQDNNAAAIAKALEHALTTRAADLKVDERMRARVTRALTWFLAEPSAATWLSQGIREQEIVDDDGSLVRFDLIVPGKHAGDEWLILEYKSGEPRADHIAQVRRYAKLLAKHKIKSSGLLVYLTKERFQRVWEHTVSPLCRSFSAVSQEGI